MTPASPDPAEDGAASTVRDTEARPSGEDLVPLIGVGGSAGAISALEAFFRATPASGLAYAVIMHLSPDHESSLPEMIQRWTPLRVCRLVGRERIQPDTVYVISPRMSIQTHGNDIEAAELEPTAGRHIAVDMFLRSLADSHGAHSAAVILSGMDSDGSVGVRRIKEAGGLAIVQDPVEAEHEGMPRSAIGTGIVDLVLPAAEIPARLQSYFAMARRVKLPADADVEAAERTRAAGAAADLQEVLRLLRSRTGHDFADYKRATVLRRIARRMQVNGTESMEAYLGCLRNYPGEAAALLQDLLISVTNFFRDPECFAALEGRLDALFAGKGPNDTVRAWVVACATGEEAYSVAMLLSEKARSIESPPLIQVFASDLDEAAIRVAREAVYPAVIEADVSPERLRRFFIRDQQGYRVRRELRETVLFARHDILKDTPFSRQDLITCRNLLIYLNRHAQQRLFQAFHFALRPGGLLFLGASESGEEASSHFRAVDKKHRIFTQRTGVRAAPPAYLGGASLALHLKAQQESGPGPVLAGRAFQQHGDARPHDKAAGKPHEFHGELHQRLRDALAPASVLVDAENEVVHLSSQAGHFLRFTAGEPTRNLLRIAHPQLRIGLQAVLSRASQTHAASQVVVGPVDLDGQERDVRLGAVPAEEGGSTWFLVSFNAQPREAAAAGAQPPVATASDDSVAVQLGRELDRLRSHLRETVEQYEASTEELKASNEELQAMNEELRSATEELETSREELQSINEELTTVNLELKARVDELAHANSDMLNLMNATAIPTVFLDRALCIKRYTPSAVNLFNLIPTDLGRPLADLATRLDYPQLSADAQAVLDGLVPIEREVALPMDKWFLTRLLPYRTLDDRIAGVVLSFIDISEARRAADALRNSEERLRLLIENARDFAIFSLDPELRITIWNTGAQRLLGYAGDEVMGRSGDLIFTPEDRAAQVPQEEARIALEQGRCEDERFHLRKDGTRFWASGATMVMRDSRGEVVGFVKILRDQTDARQAREALERSQAELRHALEEAEAARRQLESVDQAKDRFLAVLSHELRNPLASITAAAELMLAPQAAPAQIERAAQVVRRQSHTVKSQLDDLLDISRLRLGHGLSLHKGIVRLSHIVDTALESTRPLVAAGGHALTVQVPQDVEIEGDSVRLAQVLANLVANAAKYTPKAGHIELAARVDDAGVEITVTDDGIGIDPQAIDRMFELFVQASEPGTSPGGGLGIGLSLARTIVEMHGGTITAESQGLGHGCRVHVRLPVLRTVADSDTPADRRAAGAPPAVASTLDMLVLVVDDNEDAAWGLAQLLELHGARTLTASGGLAALEIAAQRRPAVMLVDLGMPDLDGLKVARQLRAQPWGGEIVLIAITGWGQDSDVRQTQSAGFDAHLTKPVDIAQLTEVIEQLLAERRARAAGPQPAPSD